MLQIPPKFKEILSKTPLLDGQITSTVAVFSGIYADNKLYFFPEYTNHGLEHINSVLQAAEEIIDDHTINKILTPQDIAVLILSIILHDLGMQLSFDSFNSLIEGKNDEAKIDILDEKTWSQLWDEYLDEAKKFSGKQLRNIFGNEFHTFRKPNLEDRLNITEADKLLIGEFIRRHHPRIAHEVALKGLVGKKGEVLEFARDTDEHIKKLAGIIARSHGMEVRDTFEYLQTISEHEWANPYSVNVIFLMVVLRIADYFQFDATRIDKPLLKLKTFSSPISQIEHDKHLAIDFVKPFGKDPETLYVEARPDNSNLYLKLEQLFKDIQHELDISWAVLGEIYGKEKTENQPKIKYRRIKSNLEKRGNYVKSVSYIPEKMVFDYDPDLAKLLIAPLYGDNPTFGVRELLQNAIDACRERELEEKRLGNEYEPLIEVALTKEGDKTYFTITDNGKGMTLHELKNYFLKAGSSFRKSIDWQKKYTNEEGKSEVMRSGRFGVGVLAAFLLGDEIEVTTKSIHDKFAYSFKARLDSEQLNVTKINSEKNGSTIKVHLNKKIETKLTSGVEVDMDWFAKKKINWYEWYKFKKPKISYSIFKNKVYKDNLIDKDNIPLDSHSITSDFFDKIIWYYGEDHFTTCNGILIPKTYKLPEISITPSIHIIDYDAKLGLNLSRESIIEKPSFEKDLLKDIYKDFIAYLFYFKTEYKIEGNKVLKNSRATNKRHPCGIDLYKFLYTEKGFLFNINCFTNQYVGNNPSFILTIGIKGSVKNNHQIFDFEDSDISNHFIDLKVADLNTFSDYLQYIGNISTGYLQLHNNARVYNPISSFNSVFNNEKRVFPKIWKAYKIEEEYSNWNCWNYNLNHPQIFSLDQIKNSLLNISFLKEEHFKTTDTYINKTSSFLNEMIEYYFGENYIIPYDLEDRKKMYPKAFEELEPYMRKYLHKKEE